MSYIKGDNHTEQKHFDFLEELRQSGDTNMLGAGPYLRAEFPDDFPPKRGFHDSAVDDVVVKWMRLHDDPSRILSGPTRE